MAGACGLELADQQPDFLGRAAEGRAFRLHRREYPGAEPAANAVVPWRRCLSRAAALPSAGRFSPYSSSGFLPK